MIAISDIKKNLSQETSLIEKSIESEEIIIDDESLDYALDFTNSINKVNDSYLRAINGLEDLSKLQLQAHSDEKDVREILDGLKKANRKSIALWISLNNDEFLKVACKSALLDFRINVRMLNEYIEDIHNKFFLKDRATTEMDELFNTL